MYLSEYESYLRYDRNLSDRTVENYIIFLNVFLKFIQPVDTTNIEESDIRRYLKYLDTERNLNINSVANFIISLRSYYGYVANITKDEKMIKLFFFLKNILKIKRTRKVPVIPTRDEVLRLRKTIRAHKIAASFNKKNPFYKMTLRDLCVIELLVTTGLRNAELRGLLMNDVDFESGYIFVRSGKGDHQRVSLFGSNAARYLQEYFELNNFGVSDRIFPFNAGNFVNKIIERWAERANINKNLHAHSFRYYFVTESRRQGAEIEHIADQVGHVDLNTTRRYIRHSIAIRKERFANIKI